jgi:hypothetical protein
VPSQPRACIALLMTMLSVFAPCRLHAATAGEQPKLRFGVAADPHVKDEATGARLARCLLRMRERDCAFAVIAGDLVERGEVQAQWDLYAAAVKNPPLPVRTCAGNHDLSGTSRDQAGVWHADYAHYLRATGCPINWEHEQAGVRFIASVMAEKTTLVDGVGHDAGLDRIATQLTAADEADLSAVFVVMHIPIGSFTPNPGFYNGHQFYPDEETQFYRPRSLLTPFRPMIWLVGHYPGWDDVRVPDLPNVVQLMTDNYASVIRVVSVYQQGVLSEIWNEADGRLRGSSWVYIDRSARRISVQNADRYFAGLRNGQVFTDSGMVPITIDTEAVEEPVAAVDFYAGETRFARAERKPFTAQYAPVQDGVQVVSARMLNAAGRVIAAGTIDFTAPKSGGRPKP